MENCDLVVADLWWHDLTSGKKSKPYEVGDIFRTSNAVTQVSTSVVGSFFTVNVSFTWHHYDNKLSSTIYKSNQMSKLLWLLKNSNINIYFYINNKDGRLCNNDMLGMPMRKVVNIFMLIKCKLFIDFSGRLIWAQKMMEWAHIHVDL